jgi:hypothetical protein
MRIEKSKLGYGEVVIDEASQSQVIHKFMHASIGISEILYIDRRSFA